MSLSWVLQVHSKNGAVASMLVLMQALLSDIVALARAASGDSDSSSISQQTHTQRATSKEWHTPMSSNLQHTAVQLQSPDATGVTAAVCQPHDLTTAFEGCAAEELSTANGPAIGSWEEQSGVAGPAQSEHRQGHSLTGRESPMDGWDDLDPMAMLSQSAQLPGEAHVLQQSHSSFALLPHSAAGPNSDKIADNAVSDDNSHALHSHPVHTDFSGTPSSVTPLQPSPACLQYATVEGVKRENWAALDSCSSSQDNEPVVQSENRSTLADDCTSAGTALTADSPWSVFQKRLGLGCQAIIHSRGGRSPFGPTTVHGYPGAAFEVTHSGHVATVTLFKS